MATVKTEKGNGTRARRSPTPKMNAATLQVLSELTARATLAGKLGQSFSGSRDIYTACGYPKTLTYSDYYARYCRQDIARAVIDRPVRASWRLAPKITESKDSDTPFELAWLELVDVVPVFAHMSRVDKLAGIGKYALLFLGTDNTASFETPLDRASELLYLAPFSEGSVKKIKYVDDAKDPRFALPLTYDIAMSKGESDSTRTVHFTRVIHVAEDLLESAVEGHSRLEAVYNRLQDLELVAAGAAETFWRGGFPGYGFKLDPGTVLTPGQATDDLKSEIEDYMHGFKRYLRLKGISVEALAQQLADPTGVSTLLKELISAASGIPLRILMGSERGELASTQDEGNWIKRVEERQQDHCEPNILRPFINRLIELGVLPTPQDGKYAIEWQPLVAQGEKESAEIGEVQARGLAAYAGTPGASTLVPPEIGLRKYGGLTEEEIAQAEQILGTLALKDDQSAAEDQATMDQFGDGAENGNGSNGRQPQDVETEDVTDEAAQTA